MLEVYNKFDRKIVISPELIIVKAIKLTKNHVI